jgi:hypothetical protein
MCAGLFLRACGLGCGRVHGSAHPCHDCAPTPCVCMCVCVCVPQYFKHATPEEELGNLNIGEALRQS